MEKHVHLAVIKDDDNVNVGIYVNATHQGSLRQVATWMAPEIKDMIRDDLDSVEYWEKEDKEGTGVIDDLQRRLRFYRERIVTLHNIQSLLAQEKLDQAVTVFNEMSAKYVVEMGEEPIGE